MNNRHTHTPSNKGKIKGYNTIILFAIKRQTRLLDIHFVPLPNAEQKKLQWCFSSSGTKQYLSEESLIICSSSRLSKDIKNVLNTNS